MLKTCPTTDLLRRLLADQLGKALEASIEDHVEGCGLCQGELERLTEAAVQPVRRVRSARISGTPTAIVDDFLLALKQEPPTCMLAAGLMETEPSRTAFERAAGDRPAPDGYEILDELGRG